MYLIPKVLDSKLDCFVPVTNRLAAYCAHQHVLKVLDVLSVAYFAPSHRNTGARKLTYLVRLSKKNHKIKCAPEEHSSPNPSAWQYASWKRLATPRVKLMGVECGDFMTQNRQTSLGMEGTSFPSGAFHTFHAFCVVSTTSAHHGGNTNTISASHRFRPPTRLGNTVPFAPEHAPRPEHSLPSSPRGHRSFSLIG